MKKVRITILKTTLDKELAAEYGIDGLTACPMMKAGDVFYADYAKPQGFCDEAWKAIYQYVFALAHGADKSLSYYGDWIKKPGMQEYNALEADDTHVLMKWAKAVPYSAVGQKVSVFLVGYHNAPIRDNPLKHTLSSKGSEASPQPCIPQDSLIRIGLQDMQGWRRNRHCRHPERHRRDSITCETSRKVREGRQVFLSAFYAWRRR